MRKLASIQRIWDITPIEGADKIETAHVLGWTCVTGREIFKKEIFVSILKFECKVNRH